MHKPLQRENNLRPEKTRVLVLIKGLGLGGAEKLLAASVPHWDREQFDYEIGYLLPWKDALVSEFENRGIKVTCFNAKATVDLAACRRIGKFIQKGQFDIVHSHLPITGLVGRIVSRWHGVKGIVYTEHGSWTRLNKITRWATDLTLKMNDLTIAVSEDVAQSIPVRHRERVQTILNGIDCRSFNSTGNERQQIRKELGISENDFVIGKIANFLPVKQHETLIRAFAKFQRISPDSKLLLVGQYRGREDYIRQVAQEQGVTENVIITGPRTDIPRILHSLDIFAMSSRSEGLPVSLLEAMACALPVVCTKVGGIPAVVTDGIEGFLVPAGDADAMATKFDQLYLDRHLLKQMGEAGRRLVNEKYDIGLMVKKVEREYSNILQNRN